MWLNIEAFGQVTTKQFFVAYLLVTSSKYTKARPCTFQVKALGTLSVLSWTMRIRGIVDKRPQTSIRKTKHNGAKHFHKIALQLICMHNYHFQW